MMYRRMKSIPASTKAFAQAFVFAIVFAVTTAFDGGLATMLLGLLVATLVFATLTDLFFRRIPNWLVLGLILQTIAALIVFRADDLPGHLLGSVVILSVMLALNATFGGGEGDVKLLAAVGLAVGLWSGLEIVALGYMFAAVLAALIAAGRWLRLPGRFFQQRSLPMAPFFSLATGYELLTRGGLS